MSIKPEQRIEEKDQIKENVPTHVSISIVLWGLVSLLIGNTSL